MSTLSNLTVDSIDLGTFGWKFGGDGDPDPRGIDDALERSVQSATGIPNRDGELTLGGGLISPARSIVFPGFIESTSMSAVQTLLDRLKYHLGKGDTSRIVALSTDRNASREIRCLRESIAVVWGIGKFSAARATVTLSFRAYDAFWRATTDTTVPFTSNTAMPLGSLRTPPVITVTAGGGGCTNPTITLKNAAGTTLLTLAFTASGGLTLAAGNTLTINCATGAIVKTASGVDTNAAKYLVSGTAFPFSLDPRDGDWLNLTPTYPSLSGSVASGSATFSAVYRKRFE